MNILLISMSAPPKNSPESVQTGRYIKYLSRQHRVTLLTSQVIGGWEPQDDGIAKYLEGIHQRIEIWSLHPRLIWLLKKIAPAKLTSDEVVFFAWQVKRAIRKIKTKPNAILSRSLPFSSAIMAMRLSDYWQTPWLMHLSDLWVDSPFVTLSHKMLKKQLAMEIACISRANIVTLTSLKVIDFYKRKYPKYSDKFQFLPNVFDEDDLNIKSIAFDGKMQIVFTGRLYGTRSVHDFLNCLEKTILQYPPLEDFIEVKLAGFFDDENVARIKSSPLHCLQNLNALPYNEAITLQRNAHMLLLIDSLDEDSRYEVYFPSKLLDYIVAQRFVLAFTKWSSTSYNVVEGKYGKCFHPNNANEFADFLLNAVDKFREQEADFFDRRLSADKEYAASYNTIRLNQLIEATLKS